ncbi:hypothetical protein BST61_g160 [Cercospora zeina]
MDTLNGVGLPARASGTGLSITPSQPVIRTVERDLLPGLDAVQPNQLSYYVAAWNSLVPQDATDFVEPESSKYKVLPIGASISLLALLPSPGTVLPAFASATNQSQIPSGARFSIRWEVKMGERSSESTFTACQLVRSGASIDDVGAAYQIMEGALTGNSLSFVPWPDPAMTNNVPTGKDRLFQIDLSVSVWWPGISKPVETKKTVLKFVVPSWSTVFNPNKGSPPSWQGTTLTNAGTDLFADVTSSTVNPTLFLRNMFEIAASNLAPSPGTAVDLLLTPKEAVSSVPRIVQSVVEQTPKVQIQAGIDVANYFKGLFRSLDAVLPVDFSSMDPKVTAVGLDVAQVLNSALSIPLAASINGRTISKTMIPNVREMLPSFETVSGPLSGLAGIVSIGNLVGKITATTDKLLFDAKDGSGKPAQDRFKQLKATADFALSLVPIPTMTAMRDGLAKDRVTISVKIEVNFQLPGSTQPMKLYVPTPSITIEMPQISIPQIFMAWRHPNMTGPDVFWSLDPYCNAKMGTALQTTEYLKMFVKTLDAVIRLLPFDFMQTLPDGGPEFERWNSLLETANLMMAGFGKAQMQTYSRYGDKGRDAMWPHCYKIDLNEHGWKNNNDHGNISCFLWLGAPSSKADWRLILTHDNLSWNEVGCISLPFTRPLEEYKQTAPKTRRNVWAFRAMFHDDLSVQDALVYNAYSVGPENGWLVGNGESNDGRGNWNDRIRALVWVPGWENAFWRLNTNLKG